MHALTSVCGKRPATADPGTFFDLSPRIVLLPDGLASFRTIPGNLQNRVNKNAAPRQASTPRRPKTETETKTHMAVRLALVARFHGGLGAVHVFRDRVRRRQAVADAATRKNTTGIIISSLPPSLSVSYNRTYRAM